MDTPASLLPTSLVSLHPPAATVVVHFMLLVFLATITSASVRGIIPRLQLLKFMQLFDSNPDPDGVLRVCGYPFFGPLGIYFRPQQFISYWSSQSTNGWFRFKLQNRLLLVASGREAHTAFFKSEQLRVPDLSLVGLSTNHSCHLNGHSQSVAFLKQLSRVRTIDHVLPGVVLTAAQQLSLGQRGRVDLAELMYRV
jgi:hypothetical protein